MKQNKQDYEYWNKRIKIIIIEKIIKIMNNETNKKKTRIKILKQKQDFEYWNKKIQYYEFWNKKKQDYEYCNNNNQDYEYWNKSNKIMNIKTK